MTAEELEIIDAAVRDYRNTLRERGRVFCTGFSEKGIELSVQRLRVENVIHKLNELPAASCQVSLLVPVPDPAYKIRSMAVRHAA